VTSKLRLLDLALLVIAAYLGWQVRREWSDSHARDLALMKSTLPAARVPGLAPLDQVSPVSVIDFAEIALKNLFTQDRNPNVIVDPPKPPPPKPQPPFPVAHGVMLWDGVPPTIVLSEKAGAPQKSYHPGDIIGPWKLVSLDSSYAEFEWDGKDFKKRIDELIDRSPIADLSAPAAANTAQPASKSGTQTLANASTNPIGVDLGAGSKGCVAGDSSPAGTVVDGMKKVVIATPFGSNCHWEAAK
jgi:hypothetical protein